MTVTLAAAEDSYVDQNIPDTNYGTNTVIRVRSTTIGNPDHNQRTFARFDTSGIPPSATVVSATLRLFTYQAPTASRSYDASRVTASWGQGSITWNNQPAVAGSATSTVATGTANDVWLGWDVTADVQAFVNGGQANYGWRIKDQVESNPTDMEARIRSTEYTGTTYDPQLVVTYWP